MNYYAKAFEQMVRRVQSETEIMGQFGNRRLIIFLQNFANVTGLSPVVVCVSTWKYMATKRNFMILLFV